MAPFNGLLWNSKSFPSLKRVSFRVGNFDDACRWIIPAMENCFSHCPLLESIEIDHAIVQPVRVEDAIVRLFSIAQETPTRFPKLRSVTIRLMDSVLELARLQSLLSAILGRPLVVKTRKLFLRLSSRSVYLEAALVRGWVTFQRHRIEQYLAGLPEKGRTHVCEKWRNLTESDLSLFNEDDDASRMVLLSFEAYDPQQAADDQEASGPTRALYYGTQLDKLLVKHFTPSNERHQAWLSAIRFCDPTDEYKQKYKDEEECQAALDPLSVLPIRAASPAESHRDVFVPPENLTTCDTSTQEELPKKLRRLTVQLSMPQVWQVTEEEAKESVTHEVQTLRKLLLRHPDLSRCQEARVNSCTRLTYGGSNWAWWEELICGRLRVREKTLQVDGWARESKEVMSKEQLKVFKCSHVWNANPAD